MRPMADGWRLGLAALEGVLVASQLETAVFAMDLAWLNYLVKRTTARLGIWRPLPEKIVTPA